MIMYQDYGNDPVYFGVGKWMIKIMEMILYNFGVDKRIIKIMEMIMYNLVCVNG